MSLIRCKKCDNQYESTTKTCPYCGFTQKQRGFSQPFLLTTLIAVAIFTMIMGLTGNQNETVSSSSSSSQQSNPSTENKSVQLESNWVEGGTLHNSTVLEWKNSSYENKLATAADWLAASVWKDHLNSASDFDLLKEKSILLVAGIDAAVDDTIKNQKTEQWTVAELSTIAILGIPELSPTTSAFQQFRELNQ